MFVRVTVILDEEVMKKLRKRQAKLLLKSRKHVSFSSVVNECLKKCI
ncbi:MAG: hypothetical protein NPMRTHETA2_2850002 [Nitrosopumilales archaeon]|nr:MAG: hypothetical protein NPMRTHETA2_2850002 [Nitrosopumilales archaeon]